VPYTSTTPSDTGNNLDNRRIGKGSTLYLPVKVPGGLLAVSPPVLSASRLQALCCTHCAVPTHLLLCSALLTSVG
jgi:hypothetical protein